MIFAVTTTLDDEPVLPAYFDHLREQVDAFVVLDLGSRDGTLEVLAREPMVAAILHADSLPADGGRCVLVERARELGAHTILWLDPDERLERSFVQNLASEIEAAAREGRTVLGVWARTLDESGTCFLAHGTFGLDHKYVVFPCDIDLSHPPDAAPATQRRLTGFSAYRRDAAPKPVRRQGRYARCRPELDVVDLQAQPPRTRAVEASRSFRLQDSPEPTSVGEDLEIRWLERIFAACECEDWGQISARWADRRLEIAHELDLETDDPVDTLRAWWQHRKRLRSFVSIEPVDDRHALVVYRGERREILPYAWCRLDFDEHGPSTLSLSSSPPTWWLYDRFVAGARSLTPVERAPAARPELLLSVIMPFYKRADDFARVLPLNARYFERSDLEVVVSMDEPSEERRVLELIGRFPSIRWTVIVNDFDHPWRTPSRAINVGVRHAVGRYVLVVSPESAFVTDVPSVAERLLACGPGIAALGKVAFATFGELDERGSLTACFQAAAATSFVPHASFRGGAPYGSLCVERERLARIGAYDEQLELWGGDDDNVRARLDLDGTILGICEEVQLLHLASGPRPPVRVRRGLREMMRIVRPASVMANPDGWGLTFDRLAHSWR